MKRWLLLQGLTSNLIFLGVLLVLPFALENLKSTALMASQILIFAVVGLGFNILLAYTGLLSFGHGMFLGTGMYGATLIQIHLLKGQFILPVLVGTALAALTGVVVGFLVVLFDSAEKNAFVLPGGQVGFYRGLYEISERDDWMATVLGHEVGHVTGRHAAERYSREAATQTALQVAGSQVNSQLAMAALGLGAQVGLSLPFSREQESEADILGINYMHASNFDVRQAIPFWNRMATAGGSRPPELLSTHPDPANRIGRIRSYINERGWGPV